MSVFTLLSESNFLNFGHGIFQKVMEKVMESHGILTGQKCTNPELFTVPINVLVDRFVFIVLFHMQITCTFNAA